MEETLGSKNEFEKDYAFLWLLTIMRFFFREIKGNGFIHGGVSLQLEVFP